MSIDMFGEGQLKRGGGQTKFLPQAGRQSVSQSVRQSDSQSVRQAVRDYSYRAPGRS